MVLDIADEEPIRVVKGDGVRLIHLSLTGRATVSRESSDTGSGNRGDDSRLMIHLPHEVVLHFHKNHAALFIKAHFVGFVELSLSRGASITGISLLASSGDSLRLTRRQVDAANQV